MLGALALAQSSLYLTSPNPRVGCVLVAPDGQVIGQGSTQQAGGPHAEIMALRDAAAAGQDVRGATAYVTLEPCAHQGRTGPCCDALAAAGIAKVVASVADPNPLVAGQGFARLRAAGIQVEVGPGAAESRELNIGFFSRMIRGTPWVRLKSAASLDGTTALLQGAQWMERAATATGTYPLTASFPTTLTTMQSGRYTVAVASPPASAASGAAFTLTASPAGGQVGDKCGSYTLTHSGVRGAASAASGALVTECWNK